VELCPPSTLAQEHTDTSHKSNERSLADELRELGQKVEQQNKTWIEKEHERQQEGSGGSEGNAGNHQDSNTRGQGRSLPDEQRQEEKSRGR
jgi:hypothetical protein